MLLLGLACCMLPTMAVKRSFAISCTSWRSRTSTTNSRVRAPAVRLAAPQVGGHVFVVHGDVRLLSADATLVPTRNLNNKKWFPDGPPNGAEQPERGAFTADRRVIRVQGLSKGPPVWLGHLDGRFAPEDRRIGGAAPELAWFLEAAAQFLRSARDDLRERALPPRCRRAKHVLALPSAFERGQPLRPSNAAWPGCGAPWSDGLELRRARLARTQLSALARVAHAARPAR
jgi:hypothetical protein